MHLQRKHYNSLKSNGEMTSQRDLTTYITYYFHVNQNATHLQFKIININIIYR